ncbi:MAG TPA: MFS transporter, partial [Anaeromyxobacteraceae bacterium]|nr:MFS transporter [Anaeromyxobacteraceae bacterium]
LAMAVALLVFWLGRGRYQHVPPARLAPPPTEAQLASRAGEGRVILRIAAVFVPVIAFWALFFQYGSSWTLQADRMDRHLFGFEIAAGQVQTLDAAFVLTLIPLFATVIYPAVERMGVRVTALRKMTIGMFIMTLSFVAAAAVQARLDAGVVPHVAWQIPQYLFLAVGEVLVSVTALEFAYSQAPARWKSVIMGLWYLTIASGSLLTAAVAALNRFQGVAYYNFFAALMLGAAVLFAVVARWYRPVESARTVAAA